MSIHAFVDETCRKMTYTLAAVLVDPGNLRSLRRTMRGLLMPGQRELHFKLEKQPRRRRLIDQILASGVRARIYTMDCSHGQERARQAGLAVLAEDLLKLEVQRLVLDTRTGRDADDQRTLHRTLGHRTKDSGMVYEHLESHTEPLLWIADGIGWCYGAGGDWRRRVHPAVEEVVRVNVA